MKKVFLSFAVIAALTVVSCKDKAADAATETPATEEMAAPVEETAAPVADTAATTTEVAPATTTEAAPATPATEAPAKK